MKNSRSVHIFFSLSLMLVLVVSGFLVLLFEINGYRSMNSRNDSVSQEHMPFAYMLGKCRQAETVGTEDNKLMVYNGDMVTYIYFYEESLRELSTLSDHTFDPEEGTKLFSVDAFRVSEENSILYASYEINGKEKTMVWHLREENDE